MQLIKKMIHPELMSLSGNVLSRKAARAIALQEQAILLLFTERYNDFSFPGGGIDEDEDILQGLHRELKEETGARNIQVLKNYGYVEEYRPHWKPEFDLMHMISHFFICDVDKVLGDTKMEGYEKANGMRPVWVNIHEALAHNKLVLRDQKHNMGQSIQRETFMLEKVISELENLLG